MTNFDRKAIVREVCAYICVYLQRDATAPGKERAVLGPNTAKRITQQYVRDNLQQYKLQPLLSSVIPTKHSDGLRSYTILIDLCVSWVKSPTLRQHV